MAKNELEIKAGKEQVFNPLFERPEFGFSKAEIWMLKNKPTIDTVGRYMLFGVGYATFVYGSFMTGLGLGKELFL